MNDKKETAGVSWRCNRYLRVVTRLGDGWWLDMSLVVPLIPAFHGLCPRIRSGYSEFRVILEVG